MKDQQDQSKEKLKRLLDQEEQVVTLGDIITDKPVEDINRLNSESIYDYSHDLLGQQTVLDNKVIRSSQIIRQSTLITESNIKDIFKDVDSLSQESILLFSKEENNYLTSSPLKTLSLEEFTRKFLLKYPEDFGKLNEVLLPLPAQSTMTSTIGPFSSLDHLIELSFECNHLIKNIMTSKRNTLQNQIHQWRKVQGDGNCYYRAIIFAFLEKIILQNNQQLLINLINDIQSCYENNYILSKINIKHNYSIKHSLIIRILIVIYGYLNQGSIGKAYEIFIKCILGCNHFDYGLILYLRYILYRYIKDNETKLYTKQFSILIGNLLPSEYETKEGKFLFEGFYENYLLKMFKDAEKIIIYLTPFVLCVTLNVTLFDLNDDLLKEFKFYGKSNANADYCIEILNNKVHYELIYSCNEYAKHQKIFDYYKISTPYQNVVLEVERKEEKKENVPLNIKESGFCLFQEEHISPPKLTMRSIANQNPILKQHKQIAPLNNIQPSFYNNLELCQELPVKRAITEVQQVSSQPLALQPIGLQSNRTYSNQFTCSMCHNKYNGEYKLSLCQNCLLSELKSNMYSLYLILISSNKISLKANQVHKIIELFNHLFKKNYIIIQNTVTYIEEALLYINSNKNSSKNKPIFFNDILFEFKATTCLNCEQNVKQSNEKPLILPCGCRFCSPRCQRSFLENYPLVDLRNIQRDIICACAIYYDLPMLFKLIFVVWNSSLPYHKNDLSYVFFSRIKHQCLICCEYPMKEALVYVKCSNVPEEYSKIFGTMVTSHPVCNLCFTNSTKSFNCWMCNAEHAVIGYGDEWQLVNSIHVGENVRKSS